MPELTHACGKRVRFPSGTEGRRGRCPHCGGSVQVPASGEVLAQHTVRLDPPDDWEAYKAYLEDRGPAPRRFVVPNKLMLKTDADEIWERRAQLHESSFACPSCKARIHLGQVVCTGCGVDFRTGRVLDGRAKLNPKGMTYLERLPWLAEARRAFAAEGAPEGAPERAAEGARAAGGPSAKKAPSKRRRSPG